MRTLTLLASSIGALLCVATAATGVYFGMMNHPDWREIHLKFAISTVVVSLFAHVLAIRAVLKHGPK